MGNEAQIQQVLKMPTVMNLYNWFSKHYISGIYPGEYIKSNIFRTFCDLLYKHSTMYSPTVLFIARFFSNSLQSHIKLQK